MGTWARAENEVDKELFPRYHFAGLYWENKHVQGNLCHEWMFLSKETVVPRLWRRERLKFGIKKVEEGQISSVRR